MSGGFLVIPDMLSLLVEYQQCVPCKSGRACICGSAHASSGEQTGRKMLLQQTSTLMH